MRARDVSATMMCVVLLLAAVIAAAPSDRRRPLPRLAPAGRALGTLTHVPSEAGGTLGIAVRVVPPPQPRFPDGYGDPKQDPRYPQELAEIMAGRIAISRNESTIPASLDEVVIGEQTAQEIHW